MQLNPKTKSTELIILSTNNYKDHYNGLTKEIIEPYNPNQIIITYTTRSTL